MSSRRNFRRRTSEDDADDEDTKKPQFPSKPTSTTTPKPRKTPQQTPKKLLSFVDDEDSEDSPFTRPSKPTSQPSKFSKPSPSSSSSHKLTAAKDRVPLPKSSLSSNVQPQAGTYTKEALSELRKNTKTLAVSSKPQAEPVVILKGLIKPKGSDSDDLRDKVSDYGEQVSDYGGSTGGKEGKKEGGEGGLILNKEAIAAIRAKRERLRQAGAVAPDFISLDGGSNHGEVEGLSDEEPEFRGRIAMFGERNNSGRKGVFEDAVDVGLKREVVSGSDVDDEDEEEKIWEEEQLRKGVGRRTDDGGSRVVNNAVPAVQQQNVMYQAAPTSYQSSAGGLNIGGSLPGLDVLSISQQSELSMKALHENVRRLKVCVVLHT